MNSTLLNSSIHNISITRNTIDNDVNFFTFFLLLMTNNQDLLLLILYILLIIFSVELLLIIYLHTNNKTLKQFCLDNCFNKRFKRKKKLMIQMGHISHNI